MKTHLCNLDLSWWMELNDNCSECFSGFLNLFVSAGDLIHCLTLSPLWNWLPSFNGKVISVFFTECWSIGWEKILSVESLNPKSLWLLFRAFRFSCSSWRSFSSFHAPSCTRPECILLMSLFFFGFPMRSKHIGLGPV